MVLKKKTVSYLTAPDWLQYKMTTYVLKNVFTSEADERSYQKISNCVKTEFHTDITTI